MRFRTLFSVPLGNQVRALVDPASHEFLRHNSGFFGIQFVPTSLVAYLRPWGLQFSGWYPFVDFPSSTPVVGDVVFNNIERVASAPVTMPALVVLAIAGVVLLCRSGAPTSFRIAAIGAAVGCCTMFFFCYIAYRYVGDFVPFFVVTGVVAIDGLLATGSRPWRRFAIGVLAVLAAFGIWVNAGLGVLQQGAWSSQLDQEDVARFVDARLTHQRRPRLRDAGRALRRRRAGDLPEHADPGDFAIVGDCDALVHLLGHQAELPRADDVAPGGAHAAEWLPRVHGAPPLGTERERIEPLLAIGDQDPPGVLGLEHLGGGRARLVWRGPPDPYRGPAFTLTPGTHRLDVVADPYLNQLRVDVDGDKRLEGFFGTSGLDMTLGQVTTPIPGIEPALDGTVREVRSGASTDLCRSTPAPVTRSAPRATPRSTPVMFGALGDIQSSRNGRSTNRSTVNTIDEDDHAPHEQGLAPQMLRALHRAVVAERADEVERHREHRERQAEQELEPVAHAERREERRRHARVEEHAREQRRLVVARERTPVPGRGGAVTDEPELAETLERHEEAAAHPVGEDERAREGSDRSAARSTTPPCRRIGLLADSLSTSRYATSFDRIGGTL